MNKIVFVFILFLPFSAYLHERDIDFRIKSNKGWIRVINDPTKRQKYNVHVNKEEQKYYINYLMNQK